MSSKVATYLQEHISGEVVAHPSVLEAMSHDASVLEMEPEMVVYPRSTSDIRKVTRFAWQLAEKGHTLAITARGAGTDQTGAAIGKGVIVSPTAHMNRILEFDPKQKLIRVQPGLNAQALNDALALHGLGIPALPASAAYSTIGGAVANNASGLLSGKYGDMSLWVNQLEVVLANGEVLQTGRLSKRELNKKKGLQTYEGELYRTIDNLIEDNKALIDEKLGSDARDNVGYNMISNVKNKDGSFDLTPLLLGSQGTLGVISEMIIAAEYMSSHSAVAVAAFTSKEAARDAADAVAAFEPAFLEYYDSDYFTHAAEHGRTYAFMKEFDTLTTAVLIVGFDDFSEHARKKKLKKLTKYIAGLEANITSADGEAAQPLLAIRDVTTYWRMQAAGAVAVPILNGAYIPPERLEGYTKLVAELAAKHHVQLPIYGSVLDSTYTISPAVNTKKVGDKQKIFKLLDEYEKLVTQCGGHTIAESGEGRVKAHFAHSSLDKDVIELFAAIKKAFDPYNILNPGVKQPGDVRQLASSLKRGGMNASNPNYGVY